MPAVRPTQEKFQTDDASRSSGERKLFNGWCQLFERLPKNFERMTPGVRTAKETFGTYFSKRSNGRRKGFVLNEWLWTDVFLLPFRRLRARSRASRARSCIALEFANPPALQANLNLAKFKSCGAKTNKGGINLNIELRRRKARTNSRCKKHNFNDTERISKILEAVGQS